jgi:hypothetical protein
MRVLPAFVALVLLLSACAAPARPTNDDTTVSFLRGGGVAGIFDELIVKPDGVATLARRGKPLATFQLSNQNHMQLLAQLYAVNIGRIPERMESQSADMFSYVLTYRGLTVSGDDYPQFERSGLGLVLAQLNAMMDAQP